VEPLVAPKLAAGELPPPAALDDGMLAELFDDVIVTEEPLPEEDELEEPEDDPLSEDELEGEPPPPYMEPLDDIRMPP